MDLKKLPIFNWFVIPAFKAIYQAIEEDQTSIKNGGHFFSGSIHKCANCNLTKSKLMTSVKWSNYRKQVFERDKVKLNSKDRERWTLYPLKKEGKSTFLWVYSLTFKIHKINYFSCCKYYLLGLVYFPEFSIDFAPWNQIALSHCQVSKEILFSTSQCLAYLLLANFAPLTKSLGKSSSDATADQHLTMNKKRYFNFGPKKSRSLPPHSQ